MKRITFDGVRYEVHTSPEVTVKNFETGEYIRQLKDEIASKEDETIIMHVDLKNNPLQKSAQYEFWTVDEARKELIRFTFDWNSAEICNRKGELISYVPFEYRLDDKRVLDVLMKHVAEIEGFLEPKIMEYDYSYANFKDLGGEWLYCNLDEEGEWVHIYEDEDENGVMERIESVEIQKLLDGEL